LANENKASEYLVTNSSICFQETPKTTETEA